MSLLTRIVLWFCVEPGGEGELWTSCATSSAGLGGEGLGTVGATSVGRLCCHDDTSRHRALHGVLRCFISTKAPHGFQIPTASPSLLKVNGSHVVLVKLGKEQAFVSY